MSYRKSPLQIEKLSHIRWLNSDASEAHFPKNFPVSKSQVAGFQSDFKGKIVFPWSPGYKTDSQDFDNLFPVFPVMIVYVSCFEDIRLSLWFAQSNKIETAIRSGGHSLAAYSVCNGIIIDISQLNNLHIDIAATTATVEAGCTFEKIFAAIEQHGLHMPAGGCPTVSVAGYMQGGGYGITSRTYGMNCDCVLAVTVMLADGKIVVADTTQNTDLFWAIRGGTGGNFGVLLSIKYQLVPLGDIFGIQIKWVIDTDPENASRALYAIQENYLINGACPDLGIETILTTDTDGLKKVFFCASWVGAQADFETTLEPLQKVPGIESGKILTGKYSYVNEQVLDGTPDLPDDIQGFTRSAYISRSLSQNEWKNILLFFLKTAPNKYSMIDMEGYGGKINTITAGTNAFMHRDTTMDFFSFGYFNKETNDRNENEAWLGSLYEFMRQYTNGHSYQNYPNRQQEDFRWAYWGKYYNQLVMIKQKYDPGNFFRYQQSIGPAIVNSLPGQVNLFDQNTPVKYETY